MSKWTRWAAALGAALAISGQTMSIAQEPPPQQQQQRAQFSWQQPHAIVKPTGDLEWAPQPFVFQAGTAVRYIDFDKGNDEADGATQEAAWKHHPWDANATGQAKAAQAVDTYVFKRGVIYRGTLVARESGQAGNPIRLTSEANWGNGEAMLYASQRLAGGWKQADATTAPGLPEPTRIWYLDIGTGFHPRTLWEVQQDGTIVRIPLARDPNWTVSNPDDVKSQWYGWPNTTRERITLEEKDGNGQPRTTQKVWGVDPQHLTATEADAYQGGTVWSEYVSVMGTPYPAPIEAYDPQEHRIRFGGPWGEASDGYHPILHCRYFMENLPRFLDSAGEYYYAAAGPNAGRLYVRLPGDRDPNQAILEAGQLATHIDIRDQSHIHITGLTFRFGNVPQVHERWWTIAEQDPAAVKALGNCSDLRIANCRFEHLPLPIMIRAGGASVIMDDISITDNELLYTDHGGIELSHGGGREKLNAELRHAQVLRNRLYEIGHRPTRAGHGHALSVGFATFPEIAGNFLDRVYGAGLFIFGGKGGGALYDLPVSRTIVHHNKVTNSLLNTNDWGSIETWQGGPFYIFNNVSGDPGGYWHWKHVLNPPDKSPRDHTTARFGFAYYLDGSFKNYLFNNIGYGQSNDLNSPLCATTAVQEVIGFLNVFANNTFYNFASGGRRQVPQAGRCSYLGNLWLDISDLYFRHSDVDRPQDVNLVTNDTDHAYDTLAYKNNFFTGSPRNFGNFQLHGPIHKTLEGFAAALQKEGALASRTGTKLEQSPLMDPAKRDFRPKADSPVANHGVRLFIPWGLYATVGEWNFHKHASKVLDESWFMTEYFSGRDMYRRTPRFDLTLQGFKPDEDFVAGTLEDWTASALRFNGKNQYCVLSDAELKSDLVFGGGGRRRGQATTYPAAKRQTLDMGTNNLLIEAVFRAEPGSVGGAIASKKGDGDTAPGYALAIQRSGNLILWLNAEGRGAGIGGPAVNDGKWHHVIAEADRKQGKARIYLDGQLSSEVATDGLRPDDSLSNTADLIVGKGFAGEIDFLRVCRGTLMDADTTIEELYAWQFDGPHLRDFTGRKPADGQRDAGAIEAAEGQQP